MSKMSYYPHGDSTRVTGGWKDNTDSEDSGDCEEGETDAQDDANDGDDQCPACEEDFIQGRTRPYHCPSCDRFFPEIKGL
jgi:hypothetical protein